jgi:hypothetical protein
MDLGGTPKPPAGNLGSLHPPDNWSLHSVYDYKAVHDATAFRERYLACCLSDSFTIVARVVSFPRRRESSITTPWIPYQVRNDGHR